MAWGPAAIAAGGSIIGGSQSKKGSKSANKANLQAQLLRMQMADPARLDEILFGRADRTAETTRFIPGEGGEAAPEGFSFNPIGGSFEGGPLTVGPNGTVITTSGRILQPGSPQFPNIPTGRNETTGQNVPGTPGLVSQFREGQQPALNQTLDELIRGGAAAQSNIASGLARGGLTGSGIGGAATAIGAQLPIQAAAGARRAFDVGTFTDALNAAVGLMGAQAGVPIVPAGNTQSTFGQSIANAGNQIGSTLALNRFFNPQPQANFNNITTLPGGFPFPSNVAELK